MTEERRQSPRFNFVASAEVVEDTTGVRLNARTSDLSSSGCYVDSINPFPDGTPVQLKIITDKNCFVARAVVAYSHQYLGMGLQFREVTPDFRGILQDWLPASSAPV